jgi:hypothetical protein
MSRHQGVVKWLNNGKGYGFWGREKELTCSAITVRFRATAVRS